jgi:addiction module HigA family antidote
MGVLEAALKVVAQSEDPAPHPGELLWDRYLIPACLSGVQLAERMGVPRDELCAILHAEAPVGPAMAARLAIFFDTTAAFWLDLQRRHDRRRAARLALGETAAGTGRMH